MKSNSDEGRILEDNRLLSDVFCMQDVIRVVVEDTKRKSREESGGSESGSNDDKAEVFENEGDNETTKRRKVGDASSISEGEETKGDDSEVESSSISGEEDGTIGKDLPNQSSSALGYHCTSDTAKPSFSTRLCRAIVGAFGRFIGRKCAK